ncbi:MAG: sensor histidine kinase [Candidatus Edwardsbacteria bacterium]|nr:sensor histidine kinase [Candidatus Edwardsbacteria bacterium]
MKNPSPNIKDRLLWQLQERVKELTALHKASAILQNDRKSVENILGEFIKILPAAWQYPRDTAARIVAGDLSLATPNYAATRWKQSSFFGIGGGEKGRIEVYYLIKQKAAFEGPFLKEERQLIDSLAKMLHAFYQKRSAQQAIHDALDHLEEKVVKRTSLLNDANLKLKAEIAERKRTEQTVKRYQQKLKKLASELTLTEERERRAIASDLHDHIGQALAMIRVKLKNLEGNAVFSGAERDLEEIRMLLEQTISYTRNLTFELSPPVLYDLGFEAGLEWLAEQTRRKYGKAVELSCPGPKLQLPEDLKVTLFRSVRELMINIIKHAGADNISIVLTNSGGRLTIEVSDDGIGLVEKGAGETAEPGGFGLFSIREQLGCFGGRLSLAALPGRGTKAVIICRTNGKGVG